MKRLSILFLLIFLLTGLAACGGAEPESRLTVEQMAAVIIAEQESPPALFALHPSEAAYEANIAAYLQTLSGAVEDGILCCPLGVEATEIAVFRFADKATAEEAKPLLQAYIDSRASAFYGYAPEQAALAEAGRVIVHGRYAALLICADSAAAQEAFLRCFGDTPLSVPEAVFVEAPTEPAPSTTESAPSTAEPAPSSTEPAEDRYDHDAVLAAWRTGKTDGLTEKNRAVLEIAQNAIGSVITEQMTDYEKELAIHDWMILWGEYDYGDLTHLGAADPESSNPYGFLVQGKGICLGYTTTFQLFMDLLDIQCQTVEGFSGFEDHAWNMVCLDGDWYCVDVTWDATMSRPEYDDISHNYFNLTSEQMEPEHSWDKSQVPEANGTRYAWQ